MNGVINTELTVHCRDVEDSNLRVNHRAWGSVVHLKLDRNTNVRLFLESREDFEKLFNPLSWDVQIEEVADGSEDEE